VHRDVVETTAPSAERTSTSGRSAKASARRCTAAWASGRWGVVTIRVAVSNGPRTTQSV
jgi:hypothetical protein